MKKIISLILFGSTSINLSFAQVIKGSVKDVNGNGLPSVSITLRTNNPIPVLTYCFTDKNGIYSVSWQGHADSLKISASILGYSKKELIIPAQSAIVDFILDPKLIELKEVKVKTPPVWQRKDTINYNAFDFKQQQDRVIGDIIARLPGIEVSPGGQIKYNGKPINKYYIEGLDLLEDKYGIANNNLPADAVEKVQVLENHQPIRVLDSVSFSDRAALNIKLKSNAKMRLLGRAKVGIGASPLISEDELTGMLFKKKLQFINTYKYNNIGLDNKKELVSQNIYEYMNAVQNGAIKNDLVSLGDPSPPSISQKRYLFNSEHVASINQLLPLNDLYQLRFNLAYANDNKKQQTNTVTKFYLPADTIFIREQNKVNRHLNMLQTELSLVANRPKFYLKNILKFRGLWSSESSKLVSINEINQQLSNPFFNIANDFKFFKAKAKYILEWGSYLGFVSLPQNLKVEPGLYTDILNDNLPYDALIQQASVQTFYTDNYVSFRKRKSRIGGQYKIGFNLQSQYLVTNLLTEKLGIKQAVADTFRNKLNWYRYRIYNENSWAYENNKWRITFSLPLNYCRIEYKDTLLKTNAEKQDLFINPSFTAMLQITPMWNLSASAGYDRGFGDIAGITAGYVLRTYRSFSNNKAPLAETKSGNASVTLTFRNPLKIVFFNMGILLFKNKSNLLYRQQFNGNLETLIALIQNNYTNSATISGRLSKYFIDWKTSIAVNYGYTFGNQQQLQLDKLVTFVNKNYNVGVNISAKLSSKVTTDYSGTYFNYSSASQFQQTTTTIQSANQAIALNYYPAERLIFRVSSEHYYVNSNLSASRNYYFADINLRYKPKKSKIDYELSCQNLFNTTAFTTALLSNNIETVSEYQIRPRQFLFKMSFSF